MAITEKEVLRADTCALLSQLARPGFPAGYARIHSWRINPGDPSFTALLALYYDESARRENPENCAYYEMGGNVTPETLAAIQSTDDRDVFYKAIEYFIHLQAYQAALRGIADDGEFAAALEEKRTALERLDGDLGLNLSDIFQLEE
ncbi:MAG: hypothetical protein LBH85_05955 [Treponema sp.]|jgi:hypothetical protein|nr:hypothetical protein [Treponema sp.]